MLYKKEGLPEENEIVICTIKKILPNSVFVDLDEYKNREGLIHISSIQHGSVQKDLDSMFTTGQVVPVKILHIDIERRRLGLGLMDE